MRALLRVREASTVGQILPDIELLRDPFDARPRPPEGAGAERKAYWRLGSADCLQYGCCAAIRITPLFGSQLWHFSASLSGITVVVSKLARRAPDGALVQKAGAESPWFDQGDMDAERSQFLAQTPPCSSERRNALASLQNISQARIRKMLGSPAL
jgi:hypothetical protein